eukprot:CAMPEP_0195153744 /NCGR_PEP_ID=MMETSP0448-20130528/183302_1 /TAXON_ID=66468 /ORGANISM="Heterocapsa triquestra, Strain CCMP 448" /LENGTH=464 /DNA_ID=CAMNT_0040192515 /DNA_START=82 /DNA_END=1473 /DNA_ORIENTATION=+
MASFDMGSEREVFKTTRASVRATNLHIKRAEYGRERSARDWVWGRGIDEAKPHHGQRRAVRTCLAKGVVEAQEDMPSIVRMSTKAKGLAGSLPSVVEAQEDMPSIVRMSTKAKGPRRKPAIGHMVNMQKTIETGEKPQGEFKSMVSEADTTADEASDDQWSQHTESTQASPVSSCQPPPQQPEAEISAWPALPAADLTVPGQADAQAKTSHCEMALRFVDECKEEKAAGQRRRAKRADAARSAREATAWRTSFRRRRQKALAAKKAQWAKARGDRQQVRRDDEEGAPAASSVEDVAADRGDIKAMRAMTRATNLHMKRTEYNRERSLRDWTWGRGIEEAKPHRGQRTALRACLAKGVVEQVRRDDEEGAPAAPSVEHVEADHRDIKVMRAMSRAKNLYMNRTEYNRERSSRDWTWGRGIDEATPHRGQRTALRASLAKGVVEAQEDMPSIVRMSAKAKGPRRKP